MLLSVKSEDEYIKLISDLNIQAKALEREIIQILFYMRGSINKDQIYNLSLIEKNETIKHIKMLLDQSKKSGTILY